MRIRILVLLLLSGALNTFAGTDSLLRVLQGLPEDTSRLTVLRALFARQVLKQPDSALLWAEEYEHIARGSADPHVRAHGQAQLGQAWLVKGRHAEALPYFLRALPVYEQLGEDASVAMIHANIGEIHQHQRNWHKAREAFLNAHAAFARAGSVMWMAGTSESLAQVYQAMGMTDSAMVWYDRTVAIMEQVGAGEHAREARLGQVGILMGRGEEARAIELYRHAVDLEDNMSNDLVKCMALIEFGRGCTRLSRFAEADTALSRALGMAQRGGFDAELADAHLALSELHEATGDARRALVEMRLHLDRKDSLFNHRNSELIAEAQERYESQRKDAELARSHALLARRSTILWAVIISCALAVVAAAIVYAAYRKRKRIAEELVERNAAVQVALAEKELLLRELHHRVKNNMQTVGSLLRLQARGEQDEGTREALHEAMMRVKSLALVHQDLYRDASLTSVRMDEYIGKLARGLMRAQGMEDRVLLRLDVEDIRLEVDTAIPIGLILNELITNVLKHAFPGLREGNLSIRLKDEGAVLLMEVRDDGVGFEPALAAHGRDPALSGVGIMGTFAEALQADWTVLNDAGTVVRFGVRNFTRA